MPALFSFELVGKVQSRLVRQRRLRLFLTFLPLLLSSLAAGFWGPSFPSLPLSPFFLLALLLGLGLGVGFVWVNRHQGGPERIARLIDERVGGKDRFLTLVTLPEAQRENPWYHFLEQDALKLSLIHI